MMRLEKVGASVVAAGLSRTALVTRYNHMKTHKYHKGLCN